MGERIWRTGTAEIDGPWVSRLLLGALSDREQRLLAVRLLHHDDRFRVALTSVLRPFEMFDLDLVKEFGAFLDETDLETDEERISRRREEILDRALRRIDPEALIAQLTMGDLLLRGPAAQRIFSWSMAEYLVRRALRRGINEHLARTSLRLAHMVIDVVEILGAAGHSPEFPRVVADLRGRLERADRKLALRSTDPT